MRPKHVAFRESELPRETLTERGVGLEASIGVDVLNVNAGGGEIIGNKDGAMAFERFLFRAHEDEVELREPFLDAGEASAEQIRAGEPVKLDLSVLIAGWVLRASAKFPAEVDIDDAGIGQGLLERLAVELGVCAAVGRGADITEGGDAVEAEQGQEAIRGVGGVADGEDGWVGHGGWLALAGLPVMVASGGHGRRAYRRGYS